MPRTLNSYDAWKLFALFAMTVDHIGMFLIDPAHNEAWRMVGRLAMPVFCFLVGYNGSYRFRSDLVWVALFVSVAVFARKGDVWMQNILWGIFLTRLLLDRISLAGWKNGIWVVLPLAVLFFPVLRVFVDYGTLVLLWALAGRFAAQDRACVEGKIYLVTALLLTLFEVWDGFKPQVLTGMMASVALMVLSWRLWQLEIRPWGVRGLVGRCARFVSDYALYYYGVHVVVLGALGLWLGTFSR